MKYLLLLCIVYVCCYAAVGKSESANPGTNTRAVPFPQSREEYNKDEIPEREQNERAFWPAVDPGRSKLCNFSPAKE